MSKVWECIIDVFIGILLIFVSVSVYFGLRTESVIKSMYEDITKDFVAEVKKNGVLTLDEYESFMERMGKGKSLFNISFEHEYKVLEPEYRLKTLEEIIEDQNRAYGGSNDYHYREVKTERTHVDDPINEGNLNTETNESILAKAVNDPVDPNHVHDEDCYGGHKHRGSKTFTHIHAHKYGDCREYTSCIIMSVNCNSCGAHYYPAGFYYWDPYSNSSKMSYADFSGTNICNYCSSRMVDCSAPMYYYAYSCGYDNSYIFGHPEGANIKIPYNVEYEYEKSSPQGRPGGTHVSGCYTYHQTRSFNVYLLIDPVTGWLIGGEGPALDRALYTDKFKNHCRIPLYYTIGLFDNNTYRNTNPDYTKSPNLCYLTYEAYLNENGALRFKLNYYYSSGISGKPTRRGTDNPGFPDNISANQLASIKININNLFNQVFDINYEKYRQEGYRDGVTTHTKYDHINGMRYLDICPFDHSLGVDRWIHTCGFDEDGTLDCDKIITSLVPTHSEQTVYVNDPLITTAIATYRDGSTATVLCTTEYENSVIAKDKEVTLFYIYIIDDIDHTYSAKITITAIPRNKTCPKGHTYNLNADGTDPGCPYCRVWVESLRIINPTTSPIVITIGTTLIGNNVRLLATYMDGHTEEVSSGYIDNLDIHYLGTKPVTIGYKGASLTVLVTTVCARIVCDICGYEYNLYPDGTNPGCPRCIQKIPVFTGNIMKYEHINHTEEILDILYKKKRYIFNLDDVFSVEVNNKSSTIARRVLGKIYPSISDKWIHIKRTEHVMSK